MIGVTQLLLRKSFIFGFRISCMITSHTQDLLRYKIFLSFSALLLQLASWYYVHDSICTSPRLWMFFRSPLSVWMVSAEGCSVSAKDLCFFRPHAYPVPFFASMQILSHIFLLLYPEYFSVIQPVLCLRWHGGRIFAQANNSTPKACSCVHWYRMKRRNTVKGEVPTALS